MNTKKNNLQLKTHTNVMQVLL